jgi:3-isopropylmalate/(R)-2-methylmalate dehydratase small subunit
MLPVILPEGRVAELLQKAAEQPGYRLTVDLENQRVTDDEGFNEPFETNPSERNRLLNGLDEIGMTMRLDDAISAYEARRPSWLAGAIGSRQ